MILKTLKFALAALIIFVAFVSLGSAVVSYIDAPKASQLSNIKLAPQFKIEYFAGHQPGASLAGARMMALGPDGNIYLSLPKQNKVVMLPDANHDGVADKVVLVAENGLNAPHGLAFANGKLYVANKDSVVRLEQKEHQWPASAATPIIQNLATGGHTLKSLKVGPDNHLYLNVGSSCNVCVEDDPTRATILRYTLEGKPAGALPTLGRHAPTAIWAKGLRNSQGFAWHPVTGAMFATNEGGDNRSEFKNGKVNDELPPEHLNIIEAGKHYGWPHCWGKQFTDPNFAGEEGFCANTQAPAITFTSHTTPIGISFLDKANVPADFKQDAIVAFHGSWNRKQAAGYKLMRVEFKDNKPVSTEDFATGWLQAGVYWGRPVDVLVGNDGAIYVSDDVMGVIYRISEKNKE